MISRVPEYRENMYAGYSPVQASKKALELCQVAGITGQTILATQPLKVLVEIMTLRKEAA